MLLDQIGLVFLVVIGGILLWQSIIITPPKHYKFIVFLGKYWFTAKEGLAFKLPFVSWVDKQAYVGVSEKQVPLQLKTKDQVTFSIALKVLYKVSDDIEQAYKALYDLEDFEDQILSIATDASIPVANGIELEDVYDAKEQITDAGNQALSGFFANYGITIINVLSDEPHLPAEVEAQANAVIAAKRDNEAAQYKAQAIKTEKIGEAEADGESVKIRMEKLGQARQDYAEASAFAVKALVDAGCTADSALDFLTRVGDNDALVTASRNGNTIVVSQGATAASSNANLDTLALIKALEQQSGDKP